MDSAFLAVGAQSLWLLGHDDQVLGVSASTGHSLGRPPALGPCGEPCFAFAAGSVWVTTSKALFRIDPALMMGRADADPAAVR